MNWLQISWLWLEQGLSTPNEIPDDDIWNPGYYAHSYELKYVCTEMKIWISHAQIKDLILRCKLKMAIKHFSEDLKSVSASQKT